MRRIRPGALPPVVGVILAVLVPSLSGQSNPRGAPQLPQFKTGTDLVRTEVIVRDSRGTFVADLTLADFELYEDGVRQVLSTFVKVIGGQAVTEEPPPLTSEGLLLPPTRRPDPGRIFVIFVDDHHIQPHDSIKARRVLQQIRDTLLHDGDLVTVVSTGYSSIQQQLAYHAGNERLNQSISRVLGSGLTPAEIIAANQTADGPAGLRHQAHVAFSTAYDLLGQLAKIPNRRKTFLYVSSGYDFNPYVQERFKAIQELYTSPDKGDRSGLSADDITRFRNPFDSGTHQFSEMQLIAELAALTRAAQRANVTFYAIDPRGLDAGPSINSPVGVQGHWAHLNTTLSSLKVLGDETGGFCLCNTNDFKKGLQRIDDETSDYYLIGYTSSNKDLQKVKRQIEVRVTRPGVTASGYRREYVILRRPGL